MRREREDYLKFNERCQKMQTIKNYNQIAYIPWMAEIKKADNKY